MESGHGEFECRSCGAGYGVPPGHCGRVLCQCGSFMRERLRPVVCVRGQLTPQAREQAERFVGCAVRDNADLTFLRGTHPVRGRDREAPAMVLRLFTGQVPETPCTSAAGYPSGSIAEVLTAHVQRSPLLRAALLAESVADLAGLSFTPRAPDGEEDLGPVRSLAGLTVTASGTFSEEEVLDLYRRVAEHWHPCDPPGPLDGLTVTASGRFNPQELAAACGLPPSAPLDDTGYTRGASRDLGPVGAAALPPEEFAGPPDRSLLGSLEPDQIDAILACNQTVMDDVRGLILNHSGPGSGVPRPDDIETWSPGHP